MPAKRKAPAALLAAVANEVRQTMIGTVIATRAAAERAGLTITDLWLLSRLDLDGPSTPGELATAIGMTTGAMTHVLDRLEGAGHLRRDRDPADRRRVIVTSTRGAGRPAVGQELGRAWRTLLARYSQAELTVLLDVFSRANQFTRDEMHRFSKGDKP